MKLTLKIAGLIVISSLLVLMGCEQSSAPSISSETSAERVNLGEQEYARDFGSHMIHVNALTTDQLPPEVARGYNIARSKSQVLLNVFVAEKTAGGDKPVTADVKVLIRNLSNQLKNIDIREVIEEYTIYYIGEVSVGNAETLIFDIDVTPKGATKPYLLSFRQQFYTE